MVLKIYYSLYGIKLYYSNVPKKVSSWNLKVFLKVFDLGAVRKAGCGHSHGCHFLTDDYTDLRVSAFQSRSMSTSTVDNICPFEVNKKSSRSNCWTWLKGGRDTSDAPSKSAHYHDLVL
jgi:hypothetical protein